MQFRRNAESDPEVVEFAQLRNVSGEVIPAGGAVIYATDAGSNFGADITKPSAGKLGLLVGIADAAILNGAKGRVQVYGYRAEALVIDDVAQAISIGDILVPVAGQWYLARSAAGDGTTGKVHSGKDVAVRAVPVAAMQRVFIGNL